MARELTDKQRQILQFLTDYISENGFPPSIREIGDQFAISSLRGVTVHLEALTKKGYIQRDKTPRSIRVIHPSYQTTGQIRMVPILGQIAAGLPIYAEDNIEDQVPVPQSMVRNIERPFMLRVKGESMVGDGILPRDLVIIRPQTTANHNDLIAARVEDEATVKRITFHRPMVHLHPSNPAYDVQEYHADEVEVIGKVVGLMRDYAGMAF